MRGPALEVGQHPAYRRLRGSPHHAARLISCNQHGVILQHGSDIDTGADRRLRHHGLVTTWRRCYWDEEDTWFYFEVDAEAWVTRQIELQGPASTPIAAASLSEWQQAQDAGRLDEYDKRFGITAELPVSEWEGHDPEELSSDQFEEVWDSARQQIIARPS